MRDGKGAKNRVTMLPAELVDALRSHLARGKSLHEHDLAEGYGIVELPFALTRKYPNAASQRGVAVRVSFPEALHGSAQW